MGFKEWFNEDEHDLCNYPEEALEVAFNAGANQSANEIVALESHAKNLATACAWAVGALQNGSIVSKSVVKVLLDYNQRNT